MTPVALPKTCQSREGSSFRFSMKTSSRACVQFSSLRMTVAAGHRDRGGRPEGAVELGVG